MFPPFPQNQTMHAPEEFSMKGYEDFVEKSVQKLPENVSLERKPDKDIWRVRLGFDNAWRFIAECLFCFTLGLCIIEYHNFSDAQHDGVPTCCPKHGPCHPCSEGEILLRRKFLPGGCFVFGVLGIYWMIVTARSTVILRVNRQTGNFSLQHDMAIGGQPTMKFLRDEAWVEHVGNPVIYKRRVVGTTYEFRVKQTDPDDPFFPKMFSVTGIGHERNEWLMELIESIKKK